MWNKLNLKATDIFECDILSALLQDAIFYISFHSFHKEESCFRMMVHRFCWEHEEKEEEHSNFRVHSGLYIHHVKDVKFNSAITNKQHEKFLNLLTMHASDNEINFIFSENKHIVVEVEKIAIYLKDLHEKTATTSRPQHFIFSEDDE